jgi:hypothetical protein
MEYEDLALPTVQRKSWKVLMSKCRGGGFQAALSKPNKTQWNWSVRHDLM